MYAPGTAPANTPPGNGQSFIDLDFRFTPATKGQLQVVVTNSPTLDSLGVFDSEGRMMHFCCQEPLLNKLGGDVCNTTNLGQLVNLPTYPYEITKFSVVLDENTPKQMRHTVKATGNDKKVGGSTHPLLFLFHSLPVVALTATIPSTFTRLRRTNVRACVRAFRRR